MAIKTSEDHPLRIDTVKPKSVSGSIGMTLCPGKKQDNALTGRWDRNLNMDLKRIADAGATTLITLMETHEIEYLGVKDMEKECKKMGLKWYHLPIIDQCAPDVSFELKWEKIGENLRQSLQEGELIVLHCMGGLGRTGTIAARLLIELGESPTTAIRLIRQARPGAIETLVQEEYILSFSNQSGFRK